MIVLPKPAGMALDQHIQLRHRLDKIITEARKMAIEQDELAVKNLHLEKLSAEQQIVTLTGVKQAIRQEAQGLEKKEYYRLDRYDHLIAILYLSRFIYLGQDDEQAIRDGILLNVKELHIDLLLAKAKEQLGAFTFENYLDNHPHMVFYELDEKPAATTKEDYEQIRCWQTNQKINCIKLEFNKFRENIKNAFKDEINIRHTLEDEIKQLQKLLDKAAKWQAHQLIAELNKLKGLAGIVLPEEATELHRSFSMFLKGDNFREKLSPQFFEKATITIGLGKISPMPIFGLSLLMYFRWLQNVSMCKIVAFQRAESSFDNLFENTFNEGVEKKDLAILRVKKKAMDRSFNDRHYESFILRGMEEQRKLFNKLTYPHYLTFFEQKELLKNRFIEDCLRSRDIELCKEALRNSIMIHENIQFFGEELLLLRHNSLTFSVDQLLEIGVMSETLCHMAPGSELINLFWDTMELIKKQVCTDRIPLFLICENLKDLFTGIFESAVKNFISLVENLPLDEKWLLLSELLHEINCLETINGIKCYKKNIFLMQFKHLLKRELKIVHQLQSFHPAKGKDTNKKKEKGIDKPFSFGYHQGPKELELILNAVDLKMNMLTNGSTVNDLMEVFTCKDLRKNKIRIHVGFTTIKFAYLRKKLEPWFTSFTPANIERSGVFISSKDDPITAHVLYNSTAILWEDSHLMDSIFDAKY